MKARAARLAAAVAGLMVVAAAAAGPPLAAAERRVDFAPDASKIIFTLGATLHEVEGSARLDSGWVAFDSAAGSLDGEIVVDAGSAETGNRKRDRDMHVKVLESEEHPRIVFRPESFEGELAAAGASRVTVRGRLEIHGGEHPLEAPAEVVLEGDRLRVAATFEVPYVEWGMRDPSKFLLRVAKSVEVAVELEGTLSAAGD